MKPGLLPLAALAALAATTQWASPARAREYPWCAQYSERTSGGRNCGFVSFAQCQAAISGVGGFCEPNPRYTTGSGRHRHERRYAPPYPPD